MATIICASCEEVIGRQENIIILTCLHIICSTCGGDFPGSNLKCPTCRAGADSVQSSMPEQSAKMLDQIAEILDCGAYYIYRYQERIAQLAKQLLTDNIENKILHDHLKASKKNFELRYDELADELVALEGVAETVRRLARSSFGAIQDKFGANFHLAINNWEKRIERLEFQLIDKSNFKIGVKFKDNIYIVFIIADSIGFDFQKIFNMISTYPSCHEILDYSVDVAKIHQLLGAEYRWLTVYRLQVGNKDRLIDCRIYDGLGSEMTFILDDMLIEQIKN